MVIQGQFSISFSKIDSDTLIERETQLLEIRQILFSFKAVFRLDDIYSG